MALTLASPAETPNIRALAAWPAPERFTGLTVATVTVSRAVDQASGLWLCFKNGALVDPQTITVSGSTFTFGSAFVAGDVVVIFYKGRGV